MQTRSSDTISATQLARNLSAAIDQVRIRHQPLAITKGKRTIAALVPPPQTGFPVADLPRLLEQLPSLGESADDLADDLGSIRQSVGLPESPWDS